MKHETLKFRKGFRVGPGNGRSQCAVMVLAPGGTEGDSENRHRGADQWLFVISGTGKAVINDRAVPLRAGACVLIERSDRHKIENTGRSLLKTISVYVPPAYDKDGEELPRGRP
jgi:mannose-6-phosphate isomerase-like protein (cupin superfamily)